MIKTTFEYTKFKFPAGEKQVRITSELKQEETIEWKYENDEELFEIALLSNAIEWINNKIKIFLKINYIPYSRQDRVCNKGEAFSIMVFACFISSLRFDKVIISDCHSEVSFNWLKYWNRNLETDNTWMDRLEKLIPLNTLIIAPDKGAGKKIQIFANKLKKDFIVCDKIRNPEDGIITSYYVPECDFNKYECLLVLDDICDGGSTFIMLADAINHPNKWLFVTHGIFSKGMEELNKRYKRIMTTDSMVTSNIAEII